MEDNEEAVNELTAVNGGDGAPHVALFGMCLSSAFSKGAQALFEKLAKEKYPAPLNPGSLSHLPARGLFNDWWMRINQRNVFNAIAESLASGFRILDGSAATSLQTD